jgi:hypothetical protein
MYITTGKKRSMATKSLCATLSRLFPSAIYVPRGKKGIEDIIEKARILGKDRICFIYDKEGKPHSLTFISVNKGWRWLSPKIIITRYPIPRRLPAQCENIKITGPLRKELAHLLSPKKREGEEILLHASPAELAFYKDKKKIFFLKVKYL